MNRPGRWVPGIGWVVVCDDLSEGDRFIEYDGATECVYQELSIWRHRRPVIVTRWADDTIPEPPQEKNLADLGLKQIEPHLTYLDDYDEVWVSSKWDLGRRDDRWHIYRKGSFHLSVGSKEIAFAIVADDLGITDQ